MPKTGQKLVIVESPTKARTISQFLGDGFRVEASMGHVRDLPASADEIPSDLKKKKWARLGVDIESGFEPVYVIPSDKKKVVSALRKALKESDELYLATDEDREGESIAWHLVQVLSPKVPTRRMVFHEITREAIENALETSREIDVRLVEAQEARRVLDRLVGYEVSPLLWKKVGRGLSAGRVQSVAVRVLVLRERERIAFHSGAYWDLAAHLSADGKAFDAELVSLGGKTIATGRDFDEHTGRVAEGRDVLLIDEETARSLQAGLKDAPFTVSDVDVRQATRTPYPPFTTSTLQQEANRKLGLSARDTMSAAQRLYERGFITYMRTDSVHLSGQAITAARGLVERRYGKDHLSKSPRQFTTKSKGAQEAHEAIRPAGNQMPTARELDLKGADARLYELIWMRTVASQMANARLSFTTVRVEATDPGSGRRAELRASGRVVDFPGFLRAYVEGSDDPEEALDDQNKPLPRVAKGDSVACQKLEAVGHETKPPARYTEASLVKALEREGIGRPSTYATIIDTIKDRGYVVVRSKQLVPTFTAMAVTRLLEKTHSSVVDVEFTADMEKVLDAIADGEDAAGFLARFYSDNLQTGLRAGEDLNPRDICTIAYPAGFGVRLGRFGPFVEVGPASNGKPMTLSLPDSVAPADVTPELLEELRERKERGDEPIGQDPESGLPIYLLDGRFGHYVQLGETDPDGEKPKRVSLPKGWKAADVDVDRALQLLRLPRILGNHPDDGEEIRAGIGQYGPYVAHGRTFASLKKTDDLLTVTYDRALELLAEKLRKASRGREPLRDLGKHPDDGAPVLVFDGRYGPYVKHGKTNASLPNGASVEELELAVALQLLEARKKAPKKRRSTGGRRKKK